jgi:hypothetical protein
MTGGGGDGVQTQSGLAERRTEGITEYRSTRCRQATSTRNLQQGLPIQEMTGDVTERRCVRKAGNLETSLEKDTEFQDE